MAYLKKIVEYDANGDVVKELENNAYGVKYGNTTVGDALDSSGSDFYIREEKAISPEYFGYDFPDKRGHPYAPGGATPVIPMSLFPCKNMSSGSITVIVIDDGMAYNANQLYATFLGSSGITATRTYIYVDTVKYALYRFEYETELTTTVAEYAEQNPNATWRIAFRDWSNRTNADIVFVADVPLEDITAEFIKGGYVYEAVTDDFTRAVALAKNTGGQGLDSLNGKTWLALGDSYTAFIAATGPADGEMPSPVSTSSSTTWGKLAKKLGMTLYSYGVARSTIRVSTHPEDTSKDYAYRPMSTRVDDMVTNHSADADDVALITFMGGTNDGYSAEKIGNFTSQANTTIAGGCHYIFNTLKEAFPKAKIVVILQPSCYGSYDGTIIDEGEFAGMDGYQFMNYNCQLKQKMVRDVAEFYGCSICDCAFNWFSVCNPDHRTAIWKDNDHVHLTTYGETMLTDKLVDTLNKVMLEVW